MQITLRANISMCRRRCDACLAVQRKIKLAMLGKGAQHVVKEANASVHVGNARAIQVELHLASSEETDRLVHATFTCVSLVSRCTDALRTDIASPDGRVSIGARW